jgi:hypothetical protein
MDYSTSTARPNAAKRPSTRPVLIAVGAAFVMGATLAGYGVWRFSNRMPAATVLAPAPAASLPAPTASPDPTPSAKTSEASRQATQAVQAAQIVAEQQGGLDQRLAAAEQRIARLDLQAQAASGNAARAEGLLIAFSARRALDRGDNLGFLADQLRLRFGDAKPNAVATIIAFGKNPVTLDQLIARLEGLSPELTENNRRFSWAQVRSEIAQLFVIRKESTPSPQPRRRLARAQLFLQTGRVDEAIAEVRNLPGVANAGNWIRNAERYAAAQNALDMIEIAAVLEPRKLRDGEGRLVEQAGPSSMPSGPLLPMPSATTSGAH